LAINVCRRWVLFVRIAERISLWAAADFVILECFPILSSTWVRQAFRRAAEWNRD
jgi:hypothetical protein